MILIGPKNTRYLKLDEKEQSYIPFSEKWSIETDTFFKNLISLISNKKIVLPKGTVFYDCVGKRATFVIQESPTIRTISLDYDLPSIFYAMEKKNLLNMYNIPKNFAEMIGEPPYKISLGFPYVVYIVHVDDLRYPLDSITLKIFYSPTEINSEDDYVYISNLLNVFESGAVCLGNNKDYINFVSSYIGVPKKHIGELNTKKIIETTINYFWNSVFNNDITTSYETYHGDVVLGNFLIWNYWTRTDPISFYKKISYLKKQKLSKLINNNYDTASTIYFTSSFFGQQESLFTEIKNNFSLISSLCGLYAGDVVEYLGEKHKIKGFYRIETKNYISLERERDKKQNFVAADNDILHDFYNQNYVFEETPIEINGQLFKKGDNIIIEFFDGSMVVNKISSINTYTNEVFFRLDDGFVLSVNNKAIKTMKKLDLKSFDIGGYKFRINTDFYLIEEDLLSLPLSKISKITFNSARHNHYSNSMILRFLKNDTEIVEYELDQVIKLKDQGEIKSDLSFLDNFEKYPFFLYYDKIQHYETFFDKETENYYYFYENNINKKPFFDHIINNDYKKIEIPGYGGDVSLAVGDHVVFLTDENSVYDVYKIKEFIIVDAEKSGEEKRVDISLENIKTGECITQHFIQNDFLVYPHHIIKISLNFNGMSSGETYIIKKQLKNFYKTYVYKLLYFIIDKKKVAAVFDNGIPVYIEDNFQEFFEKTNKPQKKKVKLYKKTMRMGYRENFIFPRHMTTGESKLLYL